MNIREEIADWLRDAYAMERGLETSLKKQASNDKLQPSLRQAAAMHLEETQRHADEVRACLQTLGADTSTLKTGLGVMGELGKGLASAFARDEEVKDLLSAYSMEHFEIACYTALAEAADLAGLPNVSAVCRRIMAEEERMARSLADALPGVVRSYLGQHATAPA